MEDILCNISAFRYHRIPPQVIALLPLMPTIETDRRRLEFGKHPLVQEIVSMPVHLLSKTRSGRSSSALVKAHLAKHDAPFGSLIDTPLGIKVSSPLYCLFQLAQTLPEAQLVMAMYEFCGSFTIFRPSPYVEKVLQYAEKECPHIGLDWRRVKGANGRPTDLWSRPPLITIAELQNFAAQLKGVRGYIPFQQATKRVTGVTASPFEAQLSILLSTPRRLGGCGMDRFENNARISLSASARKIAGRTCCYADLLFEKTGDKQPLIIECQGKMVHDNYESAISDSDRATALKQMGYNVMLLTYSQIASARQFAIIHKLIARETGTFYRKKDARELAAETELRRNLFIDWETLGT